MAGTWVSCGCEGIWGRAGTASLLLPAPRWQPSNARIYFGLRLAFFSPPFFFCLHFLFPMRVSLGECNEIKNRQNSAVLHKGVLGSQHPSQLPVSPKGTTWLLRLQVGDISSLSPHSDVAGGLGNPCGRYSGNPQQGC